MAKKNDFRNNSQKKSNSGKGVSKNDKKYTKDAQRYSAGNQNCDHGSSSNSERVEGKGTNHIEWYVPDQTFLPSAASIPFNFRTGDELKYDPGTPGTHESYRIPGIVNMLYVPTIGVANKPSDPINVASTAIYSFVRSFNSGARNYDHTDMMMYMMAMDSIYSGLSFLIRARGVAQTYNRMNRFIPSMILHSMGIDPHSIYGDLANVTTRINSLILKAGTLAVPSVLPIFQRHTYMCQNIYLDETNDRAQMYLFNPKVLHKFQVNKETGLGELLAEPFVHGLNSFEAKIDQVESMIDTLYGDDDAAIMSGDIIKAYGLEKCVKLNTIPLEFSIVPIYDFEMLNQIHNATVNYMDSTPEVYFNITQSSYTDGDEILVPILKSNPKFNYADVNSNYLRVSGGDKLLDIHGDTTPEWVMRSTRLMSTGIIQGDDYVITSCGSELIVGATIYYNPDDSSQYYTYDGVVVMPGDVSLFTPDLQLLQYAQQTSFFPIIYVGTNPEGPIIPFMNSDKTTVLHMENIEQLNTVALLGMFNVPRLTLGQRS